MSAAFAVAHAGFTVAVAAGFQCLKFWQSPLFYDSCAIPGFTPCAFYITVISFLLFLLKAAVLAALTLQLVLSLLSLLLLFIISALAVAAVLCCMVVLEL